MERGAGRFQSVATSSLAVGSSLSVSEHLGRSSCSHQCDLVAQYCYYASTWSTLQTFAKYSSDRFINTAKPLAGNTTTSQRTTTNLPAITSVTSSLLKTLSRRRGRRTQSPGTDYSNFGLSRSHRTQLRLTSALLAAALRPPSATATHSARTHDQFDDYLIDPRRGMRTRSRPNSGLTVVDNVSLPTNLAHAHRQFAGNTCRCFGFDNASRLRFNARSCGTTNRRIYCGKHLCGTGLNRSTSLPN